MTRDRLFVVCLFLVFPWKEQGREKGRVTKRSVLFFWSVFCLFVFSGFVLEPRNVEGPKPARRRYLLREKEPLGNVKLPSSVITFACYLRLLLLLLPTPLLTATIILCGFCRVRGKV